MTETKRADSPPSHRPVRQLLAASVGNAVEWYDWYAYTFLATYIAAEVFPKGADDSLVPLLSTFAVFAVATGAIAFSFMYNTATVGATTPLTPLDLVDAKRKGKIASAYPHDDDAVLYLFTLYAQKYGWDWVAKFAAQDVQFARGSNSPGDAVFGGQKAIGVGTAGSAAGTSPVTFAIGAGHPFMAWGQRTAVLKQAKNSTAAKLFLNWLLSTEMQNGSFNGWSVRTDITPPAGLKPIWEYPNAHVDGFPRFMSDRAAVERWKQTFALYFGEVKGDPTPGVLGLHPGA